MEIIFLQMFCQVLLHIIMNGVKIGKGAVIGAGAVLMENMVVPDYSVAVGIPGRIIKKLTNQAYVENVRWAKKYVKLARLNKEQ